MHYNFYDEITYMEPSAPVPYEIEYFDRQSLREIRTMLNNGAYNNKIIISEHLLFLEHLAEKLQQITLNEQSAGVSATMLRTNISEIKNLYSTLSSMLDKFSSAS
jgi:hypothetical protein